MSLLRSVLPLAALVALALSPRPAAAQTGGVPSEAPSGLTTTFSLGGGGEMGVDEGEDAGLGEVEVTAGWEFPDRGIRPEVAVALGFEPDDHVALRGGLRYDLARLPLAVRVAVDAANSRGDGLRWRWLLVGLVGEIRFTGLLGLYAEVDSGAPLNGDAGLPLMARAGASFRF